MRYLYYTSYLSGRSGLSNGIMSVEVGVILAHLTNRLLVLDGNIPPPANVVAYDGRVTNARPSRVTDLIDVPVPWVEPDAVEWAALPALDLTNLSLGDFALCFPNTMDLSTSDARSFARDRKHWVTVTGAHEQVPVLRLSEEPLVPGTQRHRDNLCSYSYLFYLDSETRRSVYRLLQQMQAKRPFAELAQRVARDLGPFNAVHLRRGDFKVTYGVTTLDRQPREAIEAMDQLFKRKDPLVILTDERDDPFFKEIKVAYPNHTFIDWHILDHHGAEFAALPQTDSLSLAYLSQLVASEAKEFIGTMTSTFTGLVQRYRGSRGKNEQFRYLWNELPEPEDEVERGRHAINECIPLDRGQMVEQFPGRYSWNRVSQLLNPAWMREWPESFLLPTTVASGVLPHKGTTVEVGVAAPPVATATPATALHVTFENLQVAVWCRDAAVLRRLGPGLGAHVDTEPRNVIANIDISVTGGGAAYSIEQRGQRERVDCDKTQLPASVKRRIAEVFARARHHYAWLAASAFTKAGRGLLIVGVPAASSEALRRALDTAGWEFLDGGTLAVSASDLMIVPLGAQPPAAERRAWRVSTPLESIVLTKPAPLYAQETSLVPLSPAAAAAALIGASLDFHIDRHRAVTLLCRVVEKRPTAQVHFNRPTDAASVISRWADTHLEVAA